MELATSYSTGRTNAMRKDAIG